LTFFLYGSLAEIIGIDDQNQHQTVLINLGNFEVFGFCSRNAKFLPGVDFSKVQGLSDAQDGKSKI